MREKMKRYELANNVDVNTLIKSGFREGGFIKEMPSPKYFYYKYLLNDIELHVEVSVNADGTLFFDDYTSVYVIDDTFGQPYMPFYNEEFDSHYLNKVIIKYNEAMDSLVEKGIFKKLKKKNKEKVLEK